MKEVETVKDLNLNSLVEPLLRWYEENRRILPWREDPSPYHVWISEIMLQQTRVEAVKEYYKRFLRELPGIENLADVEEEKLLKLWEGLGYYNRARNLKKAAIVIKEQYGGIMPGEYEKLLSLPGIGNYTAGAIASIAFGEDVPAVDGNVLRVITRVSADFSDISEERTKKKIGAELTNVLPKGNSGKFNQALMDLGAMVCLPNGTPKCNLCPWNELCLARQNNQISKLPVKPSKKARVIEKRTVLVIELSGKVLLHKRPNHGLLAGLYELPAIEQHCDEAAVVDYVKDLGLSPLYIEVLPESKHIFSHKEWLMKAYRIKADELSEHANITKDQKAWKFVSPKMTKEQFPIPSAFAAYDQYIYQNKR